MSDSSALQSALTTLLQYNYVTGMLILTHERPVSNLITVSILAAVGYDYGELWFLLRCDVPTSTLHCQSSRFQTRYTFSPPCAQGFPH